MPHPLINYQKVRLRIQPGDVIAFSGTGFLASLIEAFSGSRLSHVAVVRQAAHDPSDATIIESTITDNRNGVQTNPLGDRIANYDDDGRIWWLPLSQQIRQMIRWDKFWEFCGAADGIVGYDTPGLFEFLWRSIPFLGPRVAQKENEQRMVCSACAVALFEACGVLRGINYSKVTPQDLAEMRLYARYVQLAGKPAKIRNFNTV